jgi:hypothetical protein
MSIFQRSVPWWQFWNPRSGLVGGVVAGVLVNLFVWLALRA